MAVPQLLMMMMLAMMAKVGSAAVAVAGCVEGRGELYRGTESTSAGSGRCLNWGDVVSRDYDTQRNPDSGTGVGDHNFCRNPDGAPRPWCYVAAVGGGAPPGTWGGAPPGLTGPPPGLTGPTAPSPRAPEMVGRRAWRWSDRPPLPPPPPPGPPQLGAPQSCETPPRTPEWGARPATHLLHPAGACSRGSLGDLHPRGCPRSCPLCCPLCCPMPRGPRRGAEGRRKTWE